MSIPVEECTFDSVTVTHADVHINGVEIEVSVCVNGMFVCFGLPEALSFRALIGPRDDKSEISEIDCGITLALMPHENFMEEVTFYVLRNVVHGNRSYILQLAKEKYLKMLILEKEFSRNKIFAKRQG